MNCTEVNRQLSALLDQTLDTESAERIEAHLSACASCRADWDQLRALEAALRSSEIHPASAALRERVMRAFRQQQVRRGWRRLIFGSVRIPKPALPLAAAAVVAALGLAFGLGRLTASRVDFSSSVPAAPLIAPPTIVKVPNESIRIIERERIVYVHLPGTRAKSKGPPQTAARMDLADPSSAAKSPASLAGAAKAESSSPAIDSLENFVPIKGATARVIRRNEQ